MIQAANYVTIKQHSRGIDEYMTPYNTAYAALAEETAAYTATLQYALLGDTVTVNASLPSKISQTDTDIST